MIDVEKEKYGLKGAAAAGVLLAAATMAVGGLFAAEKREPVESAAIYSTQEPEGASSGASEEEAASYGDTVPLISTEIAAEKEPAAYSKVMEDGEYIAGIIAPAGDETYTSKELILVNPWHLLPENYEAELEYVEYGHQMDACAAEHLRDMLEDCREEGYSPLICSSYRDRHKQEILFENDVRRFMYRGMTEEEAREETARNVAVPGSSEHEAGLAVDIVYSRHQVLDESQEQNDTQQWLMEHCQDYGFILRYPRDKQEITGITYEPWHYRYVGEEAANEIMDRGICLEEYLGVIDAEIEEPDGDYENEEE